MNYFKVLLDTFKPFLDGEKKPLNTLEVGNIWMYTGMGQSTLRLEEIWLNTIEDQELRKIIHEIFLTHREIVNDLQEFLVKEGVPLPKASAVKPIGDFRYIPEGAKYTDQEIANLMSFNLLIAMTHGVRTFTESVRADVGFMFLKFLIKHMSVAVPLKQFIIERGWIQEAPPYINHVYQ